MFNFLFNRTRLDFVVRAEFVADSVGAFLINLDRATDRLAFVKPNIDRLGFPVERISGIDGKLLSKEELHKVCDYERFKSYFKMLPERGTIGCSLSHEKALKKFLESEYEFALIFEDDVVFNPQELRECIDAAIEKKNLWDILNFETFHDGLPVKIADLCSDKHLALYFSSITHAGCYLINRSTAKKLLEKFYPIVMPFDHYFVASWEFDIKFVGVEPRIVQQNFGNSQIKSETTQNFESFGIKLSNAVFNSRRAVTGFIYNSYLFLRNFAD
ncbi:MAG: glycosyltransferase family 25 protein [Alphaproteobacteria bacterium]|nr:glycosyltransferase family 25 protein [Alphaproteobacteria bacterium]